MVMGMRRGGAPELI
jgi:hypothetical protein